MFHIVDILELFYALVALMTKDIVECTFQRFIKVMNSASVFLILRTTCFVRVNKS